MFNGTWPALMTRLKKDLTRQGFHIYVTLNPQILTGCASDIRLSSYLKMASCRIADGVGLTKAASWVYGVSIKRFTGIDFVEKILRDSSLSVYLVGSQDVVLQKAIQTIHSFPIHAQIVGSHHGYFKDNETDRVLKDISDKKPDIVLVGLGFPKQELFLLRAKQLLSSGVGIGVGGSFDVISQTVVRAPLWIQNLGYEWLYRGLMSPKRLMTWSFMFSFVIMSVKTKYNYKRCCK